MFRLLFCCLLLLTGAICTARVAAAADVTLRTDHPQYAGEGAFQTVADCVAFATAGSTDAQEKAIAMYLWLLGHQWHLMSPMEWSVPGRIPDAADPGDYETVMFDANRARFSYGYGLCGTVHAWNEPYWKALGMPARRREFPQHVNSEIFYNNEWHAFDTDMAGLLFRPDGVVAGYADIQAEPKLAESVKSPLPHYPFAWPSDFNTMKQGWQQVAARKKWYRLYNGGYAAHPGIVHLRRGETFTRWYDRDHYGGSGKRRFWQHQKGGPFRQWTYFDNGTPVHDGSHANARSRASYCNGEFVYEPALNTSRSREGMASHSANVAHRDDAPALYSADGAKASVTFQHFSPYVICGDPVDDANPMSGVATDGLVIRGRLVGTVQCEISADGGQTWKSVAISPPADLPKPADAAPTERGTPFRVDVTEYIKGRYGWHVRFSWQNAAGLDALKFVTTTQVCQAMYPRLTSNGCTVTCRSRSRAVVAVLPNFGVPESQVAAFEETTLRSKNLRYTPRSAKQRYAYQATDRQPASVVFKLSAPENLMEVRAAVRYQVPVPPPEGCDFRLDVSTDGGQTWTQFAVADVPADNEFSSGWLSGRVDTAAADATDALVRFRMHSPGRRAALIDAQLYGIHELKQQGPVSVEFGWLEGGTLQTYETRLAAEADSSTFRVPTSGNVQDSFVRLRALD